MAGSQNMWSTAAAAEEESLKKSNPNAATGNQTGNTPYGGAGAANYGSTAYGLGQTGQQSGAYNGAYGYSEPGSGQWWGGLNDQGVRAAAASDSVLFDQYAQKQYGLNAGSNTGQWMSQTYNPYAMADAFGNSSSNFSDRMGQGSALASIVDRPGYQEFDPGQVVAAALQNAAAAGKNPTGGNKGPIGLLAMGTPQEQMQNTLQFIEQALSGIMPEESLSAYMAYISKVGMQIVSQSFNNANVADFEKGGGTFASKLLAILGPTGGL